jgi:hypothetical protein
MVLQLSDMGGDEEGAAVLDAELVSMLRSAIDSLVHLTDGLQEAARLARGRLQAERSRVSLAAILPEALMGSSLDIQHGPVPTLEGFWDTARLQRAIQDLCQAVNRVGENTGTIHLAFETGSQAAILIRSGTLLGDETDADLGDGLSSASALGASYFFSRLLVRSMGGDVGFRRGPQRCEVRVTLPLG